MLAGHVTPHIKKKQNKIVAGLRRSLANTHVFRGLPAIPTGAQLLPGSYSLCMTLLIHEPPPSNPLLPPPCSAVSAEELDFFRCLGRWSCIYLFFLLPSFLHISPKQSVLAPGACLWLHVRQRSHFNSFAWPQLTHTGAYVVVS